MSASLLREAAALMRERAVGASPVGSLSCELSMHRKWVLLLSDGGSATERRVAKFADDDEAEHFASWHPVVAFAVADWLDTQAALIERCGDFFDTEDGADSTALAVATAYLGRTS